MTAVRSWNDGQLGTAELDSSSLGDKVKVRLMRDVVRMYEANRRQGTACAKTRAETAYTENKPFKQKGTGNARRGDFNSPLLRGGGVIFGPRPRDFSYRAPRKALREALRSALVGKLRDDEVACLDSTVFAKASTKQAARAMVDLGCDGSAAIVIPADNELIWMSFRNIPRVSVIRAADLNTYHVLWHRRVLFVDNAWDVLMTRLGAAGVNQVVAEGEEVAAS